MNDNLLGTIGLFDLEATDRLGKLLAEHLPQRATIGLVGTLGAGKTRLVQALATHDHVPTRAVTSPTFTLIQPYQGSTRFIYHIDAYRIADEDEFLELGIQEIIEMKALVLIEWADRFAEMLPAETLWIRIEVESETQRIAEFYGSASCWESIVGNIVAAFQGAS